MENVKNEANVNEVTEIEIEIDAYEKEHDGKKFIAYNAYDKDGKKMTAKIVRTCSIKPEITGTYIIKVRPSDINISSATRYETLWIQNIISFRPKERNNKAYSRFI